MCQKIVEAIRENYQGADSKAVIRARKAGTFELILIGLEQQEILRKILITLNQQYEQGKTVEGERGNG